MTSEYESDGSFISDSDEDDDDDEEDNYQLLKPVFIPKNQRITIQEYEQQQLIKSEQDDEKKIIEEQKKFETRNLLAESIRKNEEALAAAQTHGPSDDDSNGELGPEVINEELEYEAWKVREIARLKRDALEREADLHEKNELMRRRNMTDEDRMKEDIRDGKLVEKEKPKWKYLQKYHHKGVFYMDQESIKDKGQDVRLKDYSAAPTLEDNFDKEKLPAVLQVKNFGKRGRTKYTHLLDQDTTVVKDNNDQKLKKRTLRLDEKVLNSYLNKRSGVGKL
eukprot:gene6406-8817_t